MIEVRAEDHPLVAQHRISALDQTEDVVLRHAPDFDRGLHRNLDVRDIDRRHAEGGLRLLGEVVECLAARPHHAVRQLW